MYTPTDMPTTYCGTHSYISFFFYHTTAPLPTLSECMYMFNGELCIGRLIYCLACHAAMNSNSVKHCGLLKKKKKKKKRLPTVMLYVILQNMFTHHTGDE